MALFKRRTGTPLSELMSAGRDSLDSGALVRALARSVVHVPLPGATPEPRPRLVTGDAPPLYVVEDEAGLHAFVYSTARRLVDAFGEGVGAASIPFSTLALGWPDGVDLVVDPGTADALEVPLELLRHVLLEIAGVPTGTSLQSSRGDRMRIPSPDLLQLMGATREIAVALPEVRSLWRAESLPDVPAPRLVLDVHVDLDIVTEARRGEVLRLLAAAAASVEPRPIRLTASVEGHPCAHETLSIAIKDLDAPYYRRT